MVVHLHKAWHVSQTIYGSFSVAHIQGEYQVQGATRQYAQHLVRLIFTTAAKRLAAPGPYSSQFSLLQGDGDGDGEEGDA